MRAKKVYPIIRNLTLNQEDDRVNEAVIDIVNLLMRDEDPSNIDWWSRTTTAYSSFFYCKATYYY